MLNGQLKPAYNVQVAVENYFIIHGYVSNDRADYNTLIPVLESPLLPRSAAGSAGVSGAQVENSCQSQLAYYSKFF